MNRWIDAEWLSKLFPDTGEGDWTYNATAQGYIDSAPSIDIVRCKECKHGTYCEEAEMYICNANDQDLYGAEHFCSYGERKESE